MAGDFGSQAHRNAAGAVEQCKWQACGQLAGLFGGSVVIGHKVHRALVDFFEQQAGDFGQPRFGIAHGRCTIAVA